MELTRDNFRADSLTVMDQAARLLYLAEQALTLVQTFEHNPHKGAGRSMRVIVEFANKTSAMLMEALFHTENKRREALATAFALASSNVHKSIEAAKALAIMEQAQTDASGTVIAHGVLPNLLLLQQEWAGVADSVQ